jgi:hypothetical protein
MDRSVGGWIEQWMVHTHVHLDSTDPRLTAPPFTCHMPHAPSDDAQWWHNYNVSTALLGDLTMQPLPAPLIFNITHIPPRSPIDPPASHTSPPTHNTHTQPQHSKPIHPSHQDHPPLTPIRPPFPHHQHTKPPPPPKQNRSGPTSSPSNSTPPGSTLSRCTSAASPHPRALRSGVTWSGRTLRRKSRIGRVKIKEGVVMMMIGGWSIGRSVDRSID